MKDNIRFLALGGLDTNGRNLYVVEINDSLFIVSCGLGYPDKSTPGVDYVIPDISYLIENKHKVKAYIIPNSHDDCLFGLPFIYDQIKAPIYMTGFSHIIFNSFLLSLNKNPSDYDVVEIDPNQDLEIGGRNFEFFEITSSIAYAFGFAIETSEGNIIFSEDFIIEYNASEAFRFDIHKLSNIVNKRPTFALLTDSSSAGRKGFTSPHHRCREIIRKTLNDAEGRIYISTYSQSHYNLIEILQECINAGRYICFYDEESLNIYKMFMAFGIVRIPYDKLISVQDLSSKQDKDIVIILVGDGELLYRKISMLALKDIKESKLYIKEADSFVVCCPPAPNFEVLSVAVLDELYRTDCKVEFVNRKSLSKIHPSEDDLKFFTSIVKPKYYIPIKGHYRELMSNATIAASMNIGLNHASIFLLDNGLAIDFYDGKASVNSVESDTVRIGQIMVDGTGVGDVANDIILERNQLAQDGVIVMSCLISKSQKQIIGGPDIQMRGYLYLKESEQILKKIQQLFIEIVTKHLNTGVDFEEHLCVKEVKNECTKYTKRKTLRSPLIEPTILIVD